MLPRVLETEAMDTASEAVDYDSMDHSEVNRVFVTDVLAAGLRAGETLDLGTGTAQIPIELCRRDAAACVLAVDASQNMLRVARQNVREAGLSGRIRLADADAKRLPFGDGRFANVISNSIVHHVPDPREVFAEAWRVAAPGAVVFFRDLFRPPDDATVRWLVETYAAGANAHQQQMFEDSLRAALTVEETRQLLAELEQPSDAVCASSDRHWTWVGRKR